MHHRCRLEVRSSLGEMRKRKCISGGFRPLGLDATSSLKSRVHSGPALPGFVFLHLSLCMESKLKVSSLNILREQNRGEVVASEAQHRPALPDPGGVVGVVIGGEPG